MEYCLTFLLGSVLVNRFLVLLMSGPISPVLDPAKAHAKKLIEEELRKLSGNPNLPLDEKLRDVSDTRISLRHDIDKLKNVVDQLLSKDKGWLSYMQSASLSSAEKDKVEKLYSDAIESDDGHFEIIFAAQDKISTLKSMVEALDFSTHSLEKQIETKDLLPPRRRQQQVLKALLKTRLFLC